MKKIYLVTLLLLLGSTEIFAQSNFFVPTKSNSALQARELTKTIKKIAVFDLDEQALRSYLLPAPMEFKNSGAPLPLEIPMPDGSTEVFNIVESPTLSPEMSALYPEIKTYTGNGTIFKKAFIRLSLTSSGFNAIILNLGENTVYFESYYSERSNTYFNYFTKDVVVPDGPKQRSCNNAPTDDDHDHGSTDQKKSRLMTPVGTQLRTFKLAIAANGEYVAKNGGTQTSGFNAVVVYANRIKAFYRNELAVDFTLVSGQNLVYTNAATDPYNNADQGAMLAENHNNLNTVLGVANYDVGHILASSGGSGGGVAAFRSVCNDSRKGMGVSGEGNLQVYSQLFMDQLIFHELGHQFGMSHTFNSTIPVCTTREATQSVEPGAGATIMSYGFTCGTDDYFTSQQAGPLMQFHTASYEQAVAFMATITCGISTTTTNTPPVVTVPLAFTIPKSTPFALTGSATDANGDTLSYCWEGTNIGLITPTTSTLTDTAQPPFFKSYTPSTSPTRTYPLLSKILDGSNYEKGDKLPSVSIVTTHRLTVRDNNASGGGVNNGEVAVTVDGNIGPFLETTNLAAIYNSGSSQNITWSVNGTDAATPNVKISISSDGGLTFPHVVLASTPNDGNQMITIPNITTTTARVKVEAVGNIFFDISNTNFAIQPPLLANVTGTPLSAVGATDGSATATPSGGATSFTFSANNTFTGAPFNSQGPLTTVSTLVFPALPAGSVINSATLNLINVTAIGGTTNSFMNEVRVHLSGAYTLAATQLWTPNGSGTISPNPAVNLPNFPTNGGTINLQFAEASGYDDPGLDATIAGAFITINYTKNGYTYVWNNGQTTQTINNLAAGNYNVTVTDASNGTATGSYIVSTAGANITIWNGSAWSNGTPTASIEAVFAGDYTATTNLAASAVSVSGTSNVVFPGNFNLTVTNGLIVSASSTLTFENNSNLIQINAATNTGNIVYKRNALIRRLDYTYWSSPVSGQELLAFTPNTLVNRFYTYNEPTKLFVQVASPTATNFATATGYSLRAPNNFLDAPAAAQTFVGIYKGVPNNGDIAIPVTFTTAQGIGYNLIGNPYPSTVSATAFLNANTGSVYFWTHQSFYNASNVLVNGGVSNYASLSLAGAVAAGTAATVSGGTNVLPNGFIQAGQGFMFLTTTSKNVTFTNVMRQANNDGQFFRTSQITENNKLWLNLTNNEGIFSQTMIAYLPNTSASFDDGYDATQINTGTVLSSKIDTEDYAIQSRGDFSNTDVVKLNVNIVTAGSYTILKDKVEGIFNNVQDFFLKDNLLGTTHNIKQTPYNFVANAGTTANRFEIVYQSALSNQNNVFDNANVIVFEQNGLLNISATDDLKAVKVFDIQGRNIFETTNVNNKTMVLENFRPQLQVLLIQITNSHNQIVTKKVVF